MPSQIASGLKGYRHELGLVSGDGFSYSCSVESPGLAQRDASFSMILNKDLIPLPYYNSCFQNTRPLRLSYRVNPSHSTWYLPRTLVKAES